MKKISTLLFRLVCLGFSLLLLVMTLFSQIRLVRTESRITALESAIREAENTRILLQIKREAALTLPELERRAIQELGLQHPEAGQITTIAYLG